MTHYNDKYGVDRFRRLSRYATLGYGLYLLHDGVSYARLAIGPLWEEILRQMMPAAKTATAAIATAANDNTTFPGLVIFLGQDTTLEPLLASLGGDVWDGTQWAEYDSMIIIEVREVAAVAVAAAVAAPAPAITALPLDAILAFFVPCSLYLAVYLYYFKKREGNIINFFLRSSFIPPPPRRL